MNSGTWKSVEKDRSMWEPQNCHLSRQNIKSSFKLIYICQDESPVLPEISHDRYKCWFQFWILLESENSTAVQVKAHELGNCLDSDMELVTNQFQNFSSFRPAQYPSCLSSNVIYNCFLLFEFKLLNCT